MAHQEAYVDRTGKGLVPYGVCTGRRRPSGRLTRQKKKETKAESPLGKVMCKDEGILKRKHQVVFRTFNEREAAEHDRTVVDARRHTGKRGVSPTSGGAYSDRVVRTTLEVSRCIQLRRFLCRHCSGPFGAPNSGLGFQRGEAAYRIYS